ncbi:hypothetical protein CI109_102729 [Kwoniella shandongensis]|uniref:Uncharacterized protein n=1 Tax=Kwoniella shandongensis TaxID=1734106 RepID=A0A5M6BZ87_9TREE|nr:uncharacterized protein CI109_004948 [Kwoniella shandongensis]KAA5526745.1 hypothetical protein CI109_004948 [Kwoniella shandongensis]
MLAGITPTQTRTWFQNRRNRHKGENYKPRKHNTKFTRHVKSLPRRSGTRPPQPTSSSSIDQVSLGLQSPQITTSEDGSRSTRAVSIASSSSSSSTSSYDSSVDSNGGFIPPYNYLQSVGEPQMTVCFDTGSMYVPVDYLNGAIPPTFNFNPSNLPTVDGSIIPTQQFTNVIPDVGVGQDGTMILSDGNMCSSSASFNPYPTPSLTPINEMYPSYPAPNCAPTPMLALDEIESLMQDALKYTGGKSLDTLLSSPQVTEVDVSSPATENSPPYSESSGESLFPIQLPAEGDGFDIFSELENFIASQNNTGYTPSPGVESLTSSPLQLAEDPDSPLQDIATLFPLFDDMGFATTCEGDVKIQQGKGLEDDKVWKEMRAAAGEGEGLMGEGWW